MELHWSSTVGCTCTYLILMFDFILDHNFDKMFQWHDLMGIHENLDSAGEYVICWAKISSTMMLCYNVMWITNSRCHSPFQSPVCFLHECMLWTWFNNWTIIYIMFPRCLKHILHLGGNVLDLEFYVTSIW